MANSVGIYVYLVVFYWVAKPSRNLCFISWVFLLLLGCQYGKPSRGLRLVCLLYYFSFFSFFFFSVSVKVLPVTALVSGVLVHRAICAYLLRIERVVELRRFLW